LNSPSNPTGAMYTQEELEEIAEVAVQNDLYVISDEIYEKIIYNGKKHISIASLGKDIYKRTITVNGVSKAYSMTGWRIGYLGAVEAIASKIKNLQSHSTSNPASISQKAAYAALSCDESIIKNMVSEFDIRRKLIVKGLNSVKGFSCNLPDGSFYCFCNIRETNMNSMDLANKLLNEQKIAVIPGVVFGQEYYLRFSFSCDLEEIEKGIARLKKMFG